MKGGRTRERGGLLWGEALRFATLPGAVAVGLILLGHPLAGGFSGLLAIGVAAFFRDPARSVSAPSEVILSPADGRVLRVWREGGTGNRVSLAIFLSLFDVHVNRSPVSGGIRGVRRRRGRFLPAFSPRASRENASTELEIQAGQGPVLLRQIAGALARRTVCWKRPGEPVERGERVGLIRFGSRVELDLPGSVRITVRPGERVRGGVTIIGRFGAEPPGPRGEGHE